MNYPRTLANECKTQRLPVVAFGVTQVKPNNQRLVPPGCWTPPNEILGVDREVRTWRQAHTPSTSRWWAAKSANSTRLEAPSLLKMCVRWDLTVFSVIEDRAAISRFK